MDAAAEKSESGNSLIKKIELAFGEPEPKIGGSLVDQKDWIIKQSAGKVHIIPPDGDKKQMLAINTNDQELFSVFNEATATVTQKLNGFHQVGADAKDGLTAWELWKKLDISDDELLIQMKEVMLQVANERK